MPTADIDRNDDETTDTTFKGGRSSIDTLKL
jgi:hypothetical protein